MASSSGDHDRQPHVVLVPSLSKGDFIPFMILTKQPVRHGVRVTFVSSDKDIASLEQVKGWQGKEQVGVDSERFIGLRYGPASFLEAIDEKMAAMLTKWMVMAMTKLEKQSNGVGDASLEDDASTAPCCIISDVFGGWTHTVAKKFAIPSHVLLTSPAPCIAMQLSLDTSTADEFQNRHVSVPGSPPFDLHDLRQDLIEEESSIKFMFYTRHNLQLSETTCITVGLAFLLTRFTTSRKAYSML